MLFYPIKNTLFIKLRRNQSILHNRIANPIFIFSFAIRITYFALLIINLCETRMRFVETRLRIIKCGFYIADCFLSFWRNYSGSAIWEKSLLLHYVVFVILYKHCLASTKRHHKSMLTHRFMLYWNNDNDQKGQSSKHLDKRLFGYCHFVT